MSLKNQAAKLLCLTVTIIMVLATLAVPCFADKARDASDSVVMIYEQFEYLDEEGNLCSGAALGSGFAIGVPGKPVQYVVTNFHVVREAYELDGIVQVYFSAAANRYVQAEIYWHSDEATDLAILRLPEPTTEREALVLCPMSEVDIDDDFAALGYPSAAMNGNDFPKYDVSDISMTRGGISKLTRVEETDCYLLDLEISEGNSGGPLVNSKGQVVGVNSFYIKSRPSAGSVTVKANYAVAIDELIRGIDRNVIAVAVAGETNYTLLFILISAGALLVALVLIITLLLARRKRPVPQAAPAATVPAASQAAAMPATMPAGATAAGLPEARLVGLSGFFMNKSFNLDGPVRIGRDSNICAVAFPVDQPGISGSHCLLTYENGQVALTDLGSSSGTFLAGGKQLTPQQPVPLSSGDRFYLADSANLFEVRIG